MPLIKFTDKYDAKLMDFTAQKAKSSDTSYRLTDFLENAPFRIRGEHELLRIANHLAELLSKIHENRDFCFETKIRMLFATSQPVPTEECYLKKVRNFADELEIDVYNRILYYKRGGLELTADDELTSAHDSKLALLNFVLKKLENVQEPVSEDDVFSDFSEYLWLNKKNQSSFHEITPLIHKFDHLDVDTKIRLLFLLNLPIDLDFFEEINTIVDLIEIDANLRILRYRNGDVALCSPEYLVADSKLEFTSQEEVYSDDVVEMSQNTLLTLLRNFVLFLESDELERSREAIEKGLAMTEENSRISTEPIRVGFEQLLEFVTSQTASIENSEEFSTFISRNEFLRVFRSTVLSVGAPSIVALGGRAEELSSELADEKIPVQRIKLGLDALLNSVGIFY